MFMKSYKMFILSALTSVLFLGVAYASYWDLEVQTTSTVNTGELSITVESEAILTEDDYMTTVINYLLDDTSGLSDGSGLQVDGNDLIVEIMDMYPGANVEYEFDVRNSGTLGILLEDMVFDPEDENEELNEEIEMEISYVVDDSVNYLDLEEFLEIAQNDEIADSESRTYRIRIWFDRDQSLEENELEDVEATYKLSINYKQFNKMSTPPSP